MFFERIVARIGESRNMLTYVGICFVVGFIGGYITKKYSKYLVFMVLLVGMMMVLEHVGMISIVIHQKVIADALGATSLFNDGRSLSLTLYDWLTHNKASMLSGLIGFLWGVRIV